jgi:tyrosyl-tRNA synthetase
MDLLADLVARGLVHDSTDRAALAARLARGSIGVYVGFDPTADSLHVGHLLGQITLRRFQLAGHRPFPLAGGATGMVGDPSGRSEERNLLDRDMLRANVERIKAQLARILDFEPGPVAATLVDNADWTEPVGVLEFLRDVGKHFTVNQMVARESVRARMESEHGISYTEFSYMLLQANDFRVLCAEHHVEMQMGGSDQWGNIVAGIELIRRTIGKPAFGLTWPLVTRTDGVKMGKSLNGALWLDPDKTSPYQFHQWWMQLPDPDVGPFLRQFTFRSVAECASIEQTHVSAPERREGQRTLAHDVTALVHGEAAARAAESAAAILFGGDPTAASPDVLATLAREVPASHVAPDQLGDLVGLLVGTGLARSNSDARRTLGQHGVRANGKPCDAVTVLTRADALHGRWILLRKGKAHHLLEVSER